MPGIVEITKFLVENNILPEDILEIGDDSSLEEHLEIELISDVRDKYAVIKYEGQEILVLAKDGGLESYVEDQLLAMDEDVVLDVLREVSDDFSEVMKLWHDDLKEYGDYYVDTIKLGSRIKQGMYKIAKGGIGNYRRGEVLTSVNAVEPGQLLILDSVVYKETNLIKVTQTFDDRFYAIFVNPENPAEKRQSSDEEFVVYENDLERGEYNIALEPAPSGEQADKRSPDKDKDKEDLAPGAGPEAAPAGNGKDPDIDVSTEESVGVDEDLDVDVELPKTSIKNPVRKHRDYGKVAYGEEPAVAGEVSSDNPITTDDTGDYEMKEINITSYNRYASDDNSDIDDFYGDEEDEDSDTESEYDLEYLEDVVDEVDGYDDFIIQNKSFMGGYEVMYDNRVIAEGSDFEEVADEIQYFLSSNSDAFKGYSPSIIYVGERGDASYMGLVKKSSWDRFEEDYEEDSAYTDNLGSHSSFASRVLESFASAPGGLGDDGSAYDLAQAPNFTGVDEEEAEVVASQYVEGKAVGFAELSDFMGFVGDSYGIKASADLHREFRRAWHNQDIKKLSSLIVENARKNALQ